MAAITNASVDFVLTTDPPVSWFGLGTRVTDVESPQLQNTNDFTIRVFHGDGNTTAVTLTYDELIDPDLYEPIVFGAVIDDWAAAVATPYGPLTRTTALADLGVNPLSAFDQEIAFTLASPYNAETVNLTYNELKYPTVVIQRLKQAVGVQSIVNTLKTDIAALAVLAAAMSAPHTEADYRVLYDGIRDLTYLIGGLRLN